MTVPPRFGFTGKESRNIYFQVSVPAYPDTSNSRLRLWEMLSWLFRGVRGTHHLSPPCLPKSSGLLLKPQSPGEGVGLCLVTSSSGGGPPCPPILEQINLIAKAFRLMGPVIRTCTCGRCVCKEWALRFLQGCSLACSLSLLWPAVLMGSMFSSTRLKCKVSSYSNSVSGPGLPGFCLHCPWRSAVLPLVSLDGREGVKPGFPRVRKPSGPHAQGHDVSSGRLAPAWCTEAWKPGVEVPRFPGCSAELQSCCLCKRRSTPRSGLTLSELLGSPKPFSPPHVLLLPTYFPTPDWSLAIHRHSLKHVSFSLGRQSLSTHWLLDGRGLLKSSNRNDYPSQPPPSTFYRCENKCAEKKVSLVHSGYSRTYMCTSSSTPVRLKADVIR